MNQALVRLRQALHGNGYSAVVSDAEGAQVLHHGKVVMWCKPGEWGECLPAHLTAITILWWSATGTDFHNCPSQWELVIFCGRHDVMQVPPSLELVVQKLLRGDAVQVAAPH